MLAPMGFIMLLRFGELRGLFQTVFRLQLYRTRWHSLTGIAIHSSTDKIKYFAT